MTDLFWTKLFGHLPGHQPNELFFSLAIIRHLLCAGLCFHFRGMELVFVLLWRSEEEKWGTTREAWRGQQTAPTSALHCLPREQCSWWVLSGSPMWGEPWRQDCKRGKSSGLRVGEGGAPSQLWCRLTTYDLESDSLLFCVLIDGPRFISSRDL